MVWHRIILPDTSSVQLDNLVGSDPAGYAGLEDGVDWHWDRIFAGAALFIWWRLVRDTELKELGFDPAQLRRAKRASARA